ncbi:MAG: hypothetical protein M1825_003553 [Sarcosagium campestre]|nr:MAG: hypothetical protein M1825_003553 [Sarcosagium campestre]
MPHVDSASKKRRDPAKKKSRPNTKSTHDSVFDESALESLTGKIEASIQTSVPRKRKSAVSVPESGAGTNGDGKSQRKNNLETKDQPNAWHDVPSKSRKDKKSKNMADDPNLLDEILVLGGTKEDLALIAEVDSHSELELEEEGKKKKTSRRNDSLHKDTAGLIKELGLDGDMVVEETDEEKQPTKNDPIEPTQRPKSILKPSLEAPNGSHKAGTNRTKFLPQTNWHAAELPDLTISEGELQVPRKDLLQRLHDHASTLLKDDNDIYYANNLSSSSSHRFLSTIMSSGTLSDKISALTLVIQESPLHTMKALDNLLTLAKKRSRGQAVTALGAVKDLFAQGMILPSERKLRQFKQQPGLLSALQEDAVSTWTPADPLPGQLQTVHLISFAYEDWLKDVYFEVLKVLESWCNDEVEFARTRAIEYVFELLKEKPEQEANLLRLLVNKLGDTQKKVASRASYLLLQLQTTHPLMKPIIVASIESELILRPGQSSHAKYYAIITLNQTILSSKEEELARKLLDIYFPMFISILKTRTEKGEAAHSVDKPKPVVGSRPRGRHDKSRPREAGTSVEEELKEKMISAILTGVNRAYPFSGNNEPSFQNHLETLFRITHSSNFNTSVQALLLIQQLSNSRQVSSDRFYRTLYESLLDRRLLTSSKQAMYLNLLFRSLKADLNVKRVKAFVKRLLQTLSLHQPSFACGALYLIRELEGDFASLHSLIDQPEDHDDGLENQDHIVAHPPDGLERRGPDPDGAGRSKTSAYDGRKRDPEFSRAERSCLWELVSDHARSAHGPFANSSKTPFEAHFHPSVSLFATRLIRKEKMPPKPDLSLHTLIHFLDKFVYRNSKTNTSTHGSSIMQPLAGENTRGMLLSHRDSARSQAPLNEQAFRSKKAEDVAVNEVFFHQYFNQVDKGRRIGDKKRSSRKGKQQDGSDGEDDEDEIWSALVGSRPELEGDDEGDSDLDMDDMESSSSGGQSLDGDNPDDAADDDDVSLHLDDDDDDDDDDDGSDDISIEIEEDATDDEFPITLDDEEDGEALFSSEDDVPEHSHTATASPIKVEDLAAVPRSSKEARAKRRKLKHLPTFASADDYAEILDADDNNNDEDVG